MTGTSARENLQDVQNWLLDKFPLSHVPVVLDVGAGGGTYADALASTHAVLEAVEVHPPTVAALRRDARYSYVYDTDVRSARFGKLCKDADVVIFGDVLEHLSIHDAHVVWDRAYQSGAYVVVSIPNSHYPQGEIDGNVHEIHLIEDPVKELIPFLPEYDEVWKYPITNTYIWRRK